MAERRLAAAWAVLRAHPVGGGLGIALAAILLALVLFLVVEPGGMSIVVAGLGAVFVLAPLAFVNFLVTLNYARRQAPAGAYFWSWGPLLGVLAVFWLIQAIQQGQQEAFDAAHPSMRERHINLSGRDLWLDTEFVSGADGGVMPGDRPGQFLEFQRYGQRGADNDVRMIYDGSRLAADFREMTVYPGPPQTTSAIRLPARLGSAYPDLSLPLLQRALTEYGESSALIHLFYHYPDHVEVAPALNLDGSQSMALWGKAQPVMVLRFANLGGGPAIARLEIDGQAVDFGAGAMLPEIDEDACYRRGFQSHAQVGRQGRLHVRWQYAETAPLWHQAEAVIPELPSTRPPGQRRSDGLDLYFGRDRLLAVERWQEIEQAEKLVLLTSQPQPALPVKPLCGTAAARYADEIAIFAPAPPEDAGTRAR